MKSTSKILMMVLAVALTMGAALSPSVSLGEIPAVVSMMPADSMALAACKSLKELDKPSRTGS